MNQKPTPTCVFCGRNLPKGAASHRKFCGQECKSKEAARIRREKMGWKVQRPGGRGRPKTFAPLLTPQGMIDCHPMRARLDRMHCGTMDACWLAKCTMLPDGATRPVFKLGPMTVYA